MELAKHMAKKDIINSLPSTVIENILCRVSIRDAVRTSILSRNRRYKWATIPKLEFIVYDMFDKSNNKSELGKPPNGRKQELTGECKIFYAIHQVLLLHQGPLLEFRLSMVADNTCVEIDQIILHLVRKNTIKKLALDFYCLWDSNLYKLPLSVLSFHQLTDLSLSWCVFEFSPTIFSGFGSLTSLALINVKTSRETLVHLISTSPLLRRLSVELRHSGSKDFSIDLNELFKCSPHVTLIEHLTLSSWNLECFATKELPTLVHLKSLCISEMLFSVKDRVYNLSLLLRRFPNLEKIKIKIGHNIVDPEINSLNEYSDIWLEHLNELEIEDFGYTLALELEFVKLILAKSPMLKKVTIVLDSWVENDEELKILRILLCYPRVSPVAKILVKPWK